MELPAVIASHVLQELDIAILQRLGFRQYTVVGLPPQFYLAMYPAEHGATCCTPWEYSIMLKYFLEDVETFFDTGERRQFSSGLWQETGADGVERCLWAAGLTLEGQHFIVLRTISPAYVARSQVFYDPSTLFAGRRLADVRAEEERVQFDPLTKLLTRVSFMQVLESEMKKCVTGEPRLSMILLDIDSFKTINDAYGYQIGDAILLSLAQLLHASFRRADNVCRYGGEEFAILLSHTEALQLHTIAQKVRDSILKHNFGALPPVSVSIGCTTFFSGEEADSFIRRCELALDEAKHSGRGVVSLR